LLLKQPDFHTVQLWQAEKLLPYATWPAKVVLCIAPGAIIRTQCNGVAYYPQIKYRQF